MTYLICLIILFFPPVHALAMERHLVKRVVDGDTLLLHNNRLVRYIGINAPEVQHGNKNAEPFGIDAKIYNDRLVGKREIYLVYGREKSDHYGRELGYVYTRENKFVNRTMLEQGLAYCLFKPPNVRYHDVFLKTQRRAMQEQKGLWCGLEGQTMDLIANKRSRRFHRKVCPFGLQTGKSNRLNVSGLWEAFWDGYAPCKRCFPKGPFAARAN